MKKLIIVAAMLTPGLGWAAGGPSSWNITGDVRPGLASGQVVLEINDRQVASAGLGNRTTLSGTYQGYGVSVRCNGIDPRTGLVACGVFADGERLKTLYFNPRLSR